MAGAVLAVLLLGGAGSADAAAPEITADAAVLMEGKSGAILYEKNGARREYPASMTKIMTCLLSLEKGNPGKIVQVSPSAADVESTALSGGEWLSLEDLTRQMMLISDNGAANAVGEAIAGNARDFSKLMNEKAVSLGMKDTHFVNASGMPDPDHYSTAEDMARLARYAMENRNFRRVVGTREQQIRYLRPQEIFRTANSNRLLFEYDGATGIKTGYTRAAGGCLAASALRDGRELIVIVMHAADTDVRFREAEQLLDYGFSLAPDRAEAGSTAPETGKQK